MRALCFASGLIWIRQKVRYYALPFYPRLRIKHRVACAEEYDTELEHMNAAMSQENQALQHDNKQLNALIKEYEQTLETLMS